MVISNTSFSCFDAPRLGPRSPTPCASSAAIRSTSMLSLLRLLWLGSLLSFACTSCGGAEQEPRAGSETNFLVHCDSTCSGGLTCTQGVCTQACSGNAECAKLASTAECVAVPLSSIAERDTGTLPAATCDLACTSNNDCKALGSDYRCELGSCRKGSTVCNGRALPSGDQARELIVGDTSRTFKLHVPASYTGSAPVPLVLDFHQMGYTADGASVSSGMKEVSDAQGFLVAWPQGIENTWDIGPCCALSSPVDDFAFVRALVRRISAEACIDDRRVYAVGYSLGASMAYYLGCRQAEVFAAVAASSMDLFADSLTTCNPSRPITEISFRSVTDSVVPYAGGVSNPPGYPEMQMELLGAVGTFQKWANLNGCTGSPTAEDANGCSTYSSCAESAEVTLCTKQEGTQIFGDANLIWDTLKRHSMP